MVAAITEQCSYQKQRKEYTVKKGFVKTENFKRLKEAEVLVAQRGALEAGLVLVRGVYGIGKSMLTERWASEGGHVFVRAKETWSKNTLLRDIAARMGLSTDGSAAMVQDRIIGQLAVSMTTLIIDEADHLIPTSRTVRAGQEVAPMLEVIRDITDVTGVMCFLVGMERFPLMVSRYPHVWSRIAKIVDFQPLTLADVQATIAAKSDVPIGAAAVELIHQQAKGRMRHVLNAIANIEIWAKANDWAQVELEHLKGRALCPEPSSQAPQVPHKGGY